MDPDRRISLAGVNTRRRRRTLDERVLVRFPGLARRLLHLWSRLPQESRLRRRMLVRGVVQGYCAGNRRDFAVLLMGVDPEIDYLAVSAGPAGVAVPDLVGHQHGHTGYRNAWRAMLEAFEDFTLEPEELLDLGDRVISRIRMRGHGSGSGAPMDQVLFQVLTFQRGRVVKQEDFADLEAALESVGVRK